MSNMLSLLLHIHYDRMIISLEFNAMFLPSPEQCELGQIRKCKPTARIAIWFSSDSKIPEEKPLRIPECDAFAPSRAGFRWWFWKCSRIAGSWVLCVSGVCKTLNPETKSREMKFPSMFPTFSTTSTSYYLFAMKRWIQINLRLFFAK